ncbi:hypothetical protein EON83_08880 [bacterium]|nr:MAG: hypothetical protein EON83_08880 [bacterium]
MSLRLSAPFVLMGGLALVVPAHAQNFRFNLRAEPDVIPANGLSTTSIFVQLPQNQLAINPVSSVRFATTAGTIESQAMLTGGVARVLLRSSSTPETATITAFVGAARETITVEFAEDTGLRERYLEVASPYVAYGKDTNIITSSGKSSMDFGDLHVESDVRLDVDLNQERLWAQGTAGSVIISNGRGEKRVELRGDRLFYDIRKRQGVIRRSEGDTSNTSKGARQEFVGTKFEMPPALAPDENTPITPAKNSDSPAIISPPQAPPTSIQGRENIADGTVPPVPDATAPNTPDGAKTVTEIVPSEIVPSAPDSEQTLPPSPEKEEEKDAPVSTPENPQLAGLPTPENISPIVPGSLADTPSDLVKNGEIRSNPLFGNPKTVTGNDNGPEDLRAYVPDYKPLPEGDFNPRIVELPPPNFNVVNGYWVSSRRLRVFPRDKVQFERASVYFNGKKAFGLPLYVLPLDGSFNPQTDMFSFNSSGGVGVAFPFYYQASKRGTGAVFLRNSMGSGFGTQASGPSLEIQQQYWLSSKSHGKFSMDQIGQGDFNVNLSHELQVDRRTTANLFVNAPRHRDLYARTTIARDLTKMQIGFEGFFDRPEGEVGNLRGQFFARMRPKGLGKSGWNYSLSANALAVQRVAFQLSNGGAGGTDPNGGGISIGGDGNNTSTIGYRSLVGQTLNASLSSPSYSPWRGSTFNANILATAFNYSDSRRGLAPGVNLSFGQALGKRANLSLNYTYDRSSLGLYGTTSQSFTHYFTANLNANLTDKITMSAFASRSLSDKSLYGSAGIDYYFAPKWRAGAFLDYANFALGTTGLLGSGTALAGSSTLTTGWSLGRTIGNRELSLNYDTLRSKVYVSFGGAGSY